MTISPALFDPKDKKCTCVSLHTPWPFVVEVHHILPLSWGGTDTIDNKVWLCAQTHYNVHFILNEFVRRGPTPRNVDGRRFPRYALNIATLAWERKVPGHPIPFWVPAHHIDNGGHHLTSLPIRSTSEQ